VQDLINSNHIQIDVINDQGNNFVAPPNQNFQIFTNPIPNHNIFFVKASETKNYVMNFDMNENEEISMEYLVGFIKFKPRKGL
jgi:hypothetical protein